MGCHDALAMLMPLIIPEESPKSEATIADREISPNAFLARMNPSCLCAWISSSRN